MRKIFAIGDIHGEFDKLIQVLDQIEREKDDLLIFLGDYIDRGPKSFRVVDFLSTLSENDENVICLKGNHEELMELTLKTKERHYHGIWISNGGITTVHNYLEHGYNMLDSMPAHHKKFFDNLKLYHETEEYYFCHAGLWDGGNVSPAKPIEEQESKDLLWIREDFINSDHDWGKKVVFGHSIHKKPLIHFNKIGIDTGAFLSEGKLTCVELNTMEFFQSL